MFRADLFVAEFNFECTGCLVSDTDDALKMTGTFRTNSDLIGLIWQTKDRFKHEYCKYPYKCDYSNVKLRFKLKTSENVTDFSDIKNKPALAITDSMGRTRYVALGFLSSTTKCTETIELEKGEDTKLFALSHTWIKWNSVINETTGKQITEMDYANGLFYSGSVNKGDKISYEYSNFDEIIIDFNNLHTGLSSTGKSEVKYNNGTTINENSCLIDQTDIQRLLFPFLPKDWKENDYTMYGEDIRHFTIDIFDIKVENGFLSYENKDLPIHGYRICEGYDDEFVTCPRRLTREMRKLGYAGITVLYIGASHFYEKWGTKGERVHWIKDIIVHKQMKLDPNKGCTPAFVEWFKSYCKWLIVNGTNKLVCSISLENLQMPDSWKQRLWNGDAGLTGWTPATSFLSLTNNDVRTYIDKIARECLDIMVDAGMPPILQLGEAWWWWQEYVPENIQADGTLQGLKFPKQPPAFYDDSTTNKFKQEMGYDMPVYKTTHLSEDELDIPALKWVQKQLCDYSDFMKGIAKSYPNGQYTVLYFPPYILDPERVSPMMRIVNSPFSAWNNNQ